MTRPKDDNYSEICSETADNRHPTAPDGKNESSTGATIGTPLTQARSRRVHDMEVSSFTYFVRDGDEIKIGTSFKPEKRIRGLAREIGRPLETLAIVPLEVADEGKTHERFAHLRVHGEWFRAEADLLQFIEEVKASPVPAPPTYDFSRPKVRFNPAKTIAKLLKMRSAIGAFTPTGRRISNIDEIRQNKAKAVGDPIRLAYLDASMARQLADLEASRHQPRQ